MSDSEKCTLEIVRLFILEKGGKCRNHDLVSRFKPFLNDPVRKLENRGKLKDFVQLLASVETQDGEKWLVLKKRYKELGCFNLTSNQEVTSGTDHIRTPDSLVIPDTFSSDGQVEPPPPPRNANKKMILKPTSDFGFYSSVAQKQPNLEQAQKSAPTYENERPAKSLPTPPASATVPSIPPWERSSVQPTRDVNPSPAPSSNSEVSELGFYSSIAASRSSLSPNGGCSTVGGSTLPVDQQSLNEGNADVQENSQPDTIFKTPEKSYDVSKTEDVSATPETADGSLKKTPLSAKDRIKQFEVSASEQEEIKLPHRARNNRDSRAGSHQRSSSHDSNDTESSSIPLISTAQDDYLPIDHQKLLEAHEKQWMLISAECDYHKMNKLLKDYPDLAYKRDFINGYNAIHWAAKHGKPEVVKLLNGYRVDVDLRSNCGYTPLHLAAMHGNEECIELLVNLCKAEPGIRDFYGKRAKQYLKRTCSTKIQQMLQNAARPSFSVGLSAVSKSPRMKEVDDNFSRTQSFSAKVKKTTQAVARKFSTASRVSSGTEHPDGASPLQNRRLSTLQSTQPDTGPISGQGPPSSMSHSQSADGFYSQYQQQDVQMRRTPSKQVPRVESYPVFPSTSMAGDEENNRSSNAMEF